MYGTEEETAHCFGGELKARDHFDDLVYDSKMYLKGI
jgi:hypothetical protein